MNFRFRIFWINYKLKFYGTCLVFLTQKTKKVMAKYVRLIVQLNETKRRKRERIDKTKTLDLATLFHFQKGPRTDMENHENSTSKTRWIQNKKKTLQRNLCVETETFIMYDKFSSRLLTRIDTDVFREFPNLFAFRSLFKQKLPWNLRWRQSMIMSWTWTWILTCSGSET